MRTSSTRQTVITSCRHTCHKCGASELIITRGENTRLPHGWRYATSDEEGFPTKVRLCDKCGRC